MRTANANDILTAAVTGTVIAQMARALIARGADTRDMTGVIYALATEGFGLPTIRALAARAARIAKAQSRFGKAVH